MKKYLKVIFAFAALFAAAFSFAGCSDQDDDILLYTDSDLTYVKGRFYESDMPVSGFGIDIPLISTVELTDEDIEDVSLIWEVTGAEQPDGTDAEVVEVTHYGLWDYTAGSFDAYSYSLRIFMNLLEDYSFRISEIRLNVAGKPLALTADVEICRYDSTHGNSPYMLKYLVQQDYIELEIIYSNREFTVNNLAFLCDGFTVSSIQVKGEDGTYAQTSLPCNSLNGSAAFRINAVYPDDCVFAGCSIMAELDVGGETVICCEILDDEFYRTGLN